MRSTTPSVMLGDSQPSCSQVHNRVTFQKNSQSQVWSIHPNTLRWCNWNGYLQETMAVFVCVWKTTYQLFVTCECLMVSYWVKTSVILLPDGAAKQCLVLQQFVDGGRSCWAFGASNANFVDEPLEKACVPHAPSFHPTSSWFWRVTLLNKNEN